MATLHITEFESLPVDGNGNVLHIAKMPAHTQPIVSYTTSTQSAAFSARTRFIRVIASAAAHLEFGDNPKAVVGDMWIPASTPEFFAVKGGHKLAAYDGSS